MLYLANLKTPDELDAFWQVNRNQYHFAALTLDGWIFGNQKAHVMRSVLAWDKHDTFVAVSGDRTTWHLVNGNGLTKWDLVAERANVINLSASQADITAQVLEAAFDYWLHQCDPQAELFDQVGLDLYIDDCKEERLTQCEINVSSAKADQTGQCAV